VTRIVTTEGGINEIGMAGMEIKEIVTEEIRMTQVGINKLGNVMITIRDIRRRDVGRKKSGDSDRDDRNSHEEGQGWRSPDSRDCAQECRA
jgi:hypothetical protein